MIGTIWLREICGEVETLSSLSPSLSSFGGVATLIVQLGDQCYLGVLVQFGWGGGVLDPL